MAETQVVLLYYIFQQRDLGVHMLDMSLSRKEDSSSARLLSWYQTVVPVPDPSTVWYWDQWEVKRPLPGCIGFHHAHVMSATCVYK